MNRAAQVMEIAKCLDTLSCSWNSVATFERTIDGRDYLFNLFDRETALELVAVFPLDIPKDEYGYYARMADDFTDRANGARFCIRGGDLHMSLSTLRRSEEDVVPAEGIAYLLAQCEALIARFAPEAFEKPEREASAKGPARQTMFDWACRLLGLADEKDSDSDLQ